MGWRPHVPQGFPALWTRKQRIALIACLLVMTVYLAFRLRRDSETVPDILPVEGPRAAELADHFDLNSVDAATLSAIPRLGEKKAHDIVAYREKFVGAHPGERAFERIEDLYHIKGVGAATLAEIRPYIFITARATTKP